MEKIALVHFWTENLGDHGQTRTGIVLFDKDTKLCDVMKWISVRSGSLQVTPQQDGHESPPEALPF